MEDKRSNLQPLYLTKTPVKNSLLLIILLGLFQGRAQGDKTVQIAFLADVHFQDIYGQLNNTDYRGVRNPHTHRHSLIRTMDSQLHSTRIFNENYFAFIAALDDIAKRDIKLVAFPGDYTDDGQPVHLRGLRRILKEYSQEYGIQFFITTGNHDPVGPWPVDAGKTDFLGDRGMRQPLFSKEHLYSRDPRTEHPVVISDDMAKMGYEGVLGHLRDFGFFPQPEYLYWETPFSSYHTKTYSYQKAVDHSHLKNRMYKLHDTMQIPDASYLVEPVQGLWILAIDGNTYVPQKNARFSGAGIGYNNTIAYKEHLFLWIKEIAKKARTLNKTLVAFSHYPAVDFNDDASEELQDFLGKDKWQLERVPEERIAETLAKAGIRLHFAGHMHINDTGKRWYDDADFLYNIQTPSLAAYIPAYKILSLKNHTAEIETITLSEVPGFDELFPLYYMEHQYLSESGQVPWDASILDSQTYQEFTELHLENLVKLRFIPDDWPASFYKFLSERNGKELLLLANYRGDLSPSQFLEDKSARSMLYAELSNQRNIEAYAAWTGQQMIMDFYKIRNADKIAFRDIPTRRLDQYKTIIRDFQKYSDSNFSGHDQGLQLHVFIGIFHKFLHGEPADHFKINLNTGEIEDLSDPIPGTP